MQGKDPRHTVEPGEAPETPLQTGKNPGFSSSAPNRPKEILITSQSRGTQVVPQRTKPQFYDTGPCAGVRVTVRLHVNERDSEKVPKEPKKGSGNQTTLYMNQGLKKKVTGQLNIALVLRLFCLCPRTTSGEVQMISGDIRTVSDETSNLEWG